MSHLNFSKQPYFKRYTVHFSHTLVYLHVLNRRGKKKYSKHNIWIPPLLYVQVSAPLIWTWYCYIHRCVLANFREHLPLITSELYDDGFTNLVWAVMSAVHCTANRPARGRVHDGAEVTAASESFLLGRLWLQLSVFILRMGPLSTL